MSCLNFHMLVRVPQPSGWSTTVRKTICLSMVMITVAGLNGTMIWASLALDDTIIVVSLVVGIVCLSMLLGALVLTTINLHLKQQHTYERQDSPELGLVHPADRNDFKNHIVAGGTARNFSIPRERCVDNITKQHSLPSLPAPSAFVATGITRNGSTVSRPLPDIPTAEVTEVIEAPSTPKRPLPPVPTTSSSPTINVDDATFELQTPEKMLTPVIEVQEPTPTPEGSRHALIIDALPINRLTWTKSTTARKVEDKLEVSTMNVCGLSSEP